MKTLSRFPIVAALLAGALGLSAAHAQTSNYVPHSLSQSFSRSIAVDHNGNIFYVGSNSATLDTMLAADGVYELVAVNGVVPANPTVRVLATVGGAVVSPLGLTVDPLGNVYVVDQVTHASVGGFSILELVAVNGQVPDNPTVRTLLANISLEDTNLSVDGKGDLFFVSETSDQFSESYSIDEVAAVNGAIPDNPTVIPLLTATCSINQNCYGEAGYQVFADTAGDLFYASGGNLYELPALSGVITAGETPLTIFRPMSNIGATTPAIDPDGNLYFSNILINPDNTFTTQIQEIVAVNGVAPQNATPVVIYSASTPTLAPLNITVDAHQNVFVANALDGRGTVQDILELSPAGSSPPPVADAALTPASADFGTVATGSSSAQKVFTLANAGTAALSISSVTVGGASPALFTVGSNTCGVSLAAGASCTVSITFAPSSPGTATATLSITDSVGTQMSTLSGVGSAPPAAKAALSPSTANFGSEPVGAVSAASAITLSNSGTAALPITSIGLVGTNSSDFAIAANTCGTSLAAGASCTISVTFKASMAGTESATLSAADSVGTQTSTLMGTGAAAAADFSLTATPDSQTVSAGSSAAYSIDVASLSGTFTQPVVLSASGLPPGATVAFAPASITPGAGGATATMTIQTAMATASNPDRLSGPLGGPLLALGLCIPISLRKRQVRRIVGLGLVIVVMGLPGCGGGFALPQSQSVVPGAQTYTVTVTGTSGATVHTTTVQISIQS
jgi:hypothetical protein